MKKILKPFLTGLISALLLILVMLKITMNFQILLILGSVIFFLAGLLNSKNEIHYLFITLSIVISYLGLFILVVLKQLPGLWYFVPIYYKYPNWCPICKTQ